MLRPFKVLLTQRFSLSFSEEAYSLELIKY